MMDIKFFTLGSFGWSAVEGRIFFLRSNYIISSMLSWIPKIHSFFIDSIIDITVNNPWDMIIIAIQINNY